MCTISGVYDHYQEKFWESEALKLYPPTDPLNIEIVDANKLRQLIADFKEAVEAAKTVDRLTDQPDCADPEKAKLEELVADLVAKLEALV